MELFLILLLFVCFLVFFTRNKSFSIGGGGKNIFNKGDIGEIRVSHILSRLPEEYHIFNDVYLENNGFSSQIDHVVISQYGVFIIETKNYSGKIYGSENAEQWTQYLQGKGHKFYSPLRQNQSHAKVIKDILHISPDKIIPIVVFLTCADLHCSTTTPVLYTRQLREYIMSHKKIAFSPDGVERLSQRLNKYIITDPLRKRDHIDNIRQNINERELQVANLICPRCKGKLVERHGKYGRFLGCSNYPKCNFTREL